MNTVVDFTSLEALIASAEAQGCGLSDIAIKQTIAEENIPQDEILRRMGEALAVMKASVAEGLGDVRSLSGLLSGEARVMKKHTENGRSLCGPILGQAAYSAFAVMTINSCMGKIVAAPTAGSSGVIPGCFVAIQNHLNIDDSLLIRGLLNASAVGMVLAKRAYISGASGGCQAECGSAAAMAASAMVEILGGSPRACAHAAALALKSLMGLVCDPVAGLVEVPCAVRNTAAASIAMVCADMALAGVTSIIPIDEVIDAMRSVADMMPAELRETAQGGLAATPTGKNIERQLFGKN